MKTWKIRSGVLSFHLNLSLSHIFSEKFWHQKCRHRSVQLISSFDHLHCCSLTSSGYPTFLMKDVLAARDRLHAAIGKHFRQKLADIPNPSKLMTERAHFWEKNELNMTTNDIGALELGFVWGSQVKFRITYRTDVCRRTLCLRCFGWWLMSSLNRDFNKRWIYNDFFSEFSIKVRDFFMRFFVSYLNLIRYR